MSADRGGDESPHQPDAAPPRSASDQAHAESLITPFTGTEKTRRRSAGRNLPVAIASAVALLAWILGTLLWWNWGFVIFLMAAAVAGSYEVISALGKAKLQGVFAPIAVGTPLMFGLSYWIAQDAGQLAGVAVTLGCLAVMIIVCLAARLRSPVRGFMGDAAASVFTIGYVPLLLSTLTLLLAQPDGNLRVIYYFLLVPCSDTAAYAVGSLLGRHKLAPHISPGKTWEGFGGAVLLTALAGALIGPPLIGAEWWVGATIGAVLSIAATTGDLIESMIKRDAGLKDMSKLVPGHGGAMDRLDSLLVAAPFAWVAMLALV
ncbi:MAG: phosphatidate cytidylyltransferase [Brooklawnia sp.]|uniref:phosphatidate cytidylyltransferase n=1 Tax=Brooklawnia sp. TaxID=2699740 RepID=UPI003C73491D